MRGPTRPTGPGRDRRQPSRQSKSRPRRPAKRVEPDTAGKAAPKPVEQRRRRFPALPRLRRRQANRVTGRVAVLALVVMLLLLTFAYPLRQYLTQRREIAERQASQREQRERVASLEHRKEQWSDPEFIKAQARERLQYVEPGETSYVIIADEGEEPAPRKRRTDHGPWYEQAWSSVTASD